MSQGSMFLIVLGMFILSTALGVATLLIVAKLYRMHDVRNKDGEYSWMMPQGVTELFPKLIESQERIVAAFAELSANSQQERKLLEHLVNAAFSLTEELNKVKNAGK